MRSINDVNAVVEKLKNDEKIKMFKKHLMFFNSFQ